MENKYDRAFSIFYPPEFDVVNSHKLKNTRLVQYTSAGAAMSIIQNKEVWLRNVQCMNDYREIQHGTDCLISAFNSSESGKKLCDIMDELFPEIISKFTNLFNSWIPIFKSNTYITCVSEHDKGEDKYGRLSMWRAYGGSEPVAIVMNTKAFQSETDVLSTYTHPVLYKDSEEFNIEFDRLVSRIKNEKEFLRDLGEEVVTNYLFDLFKIYSICVKHPGFKEEKEWRVVYNPILASSKYITSKIALIDDVPQEIHKISLSNIQEENLYGLEIPELIDRIIIGPSDNQNIIGKTMIKLLEEAGCDNAFNKVFYSGIPLR